MWKLRPKELVQFPSHHKQGERRKNLYPVCPTARPVSSTHRASRPHGLLSRFPCRHSDTDRCSDLGNTTAVLPAFKSEAALKSNHQYIPQRLKARSWRGIGTPLYLALFTTAKRWKAPRSPSTDTWDKQNEASIFCCVYTILMWQSTY